jgi:hypothetical protein
MKQLIISPLFMLFLLLLPFVSFSQFTTNHLLPEDEKYPENLKEILNRQQEKNAAVFRDEDDLLIATRGDDYNGAWEASDSSELTYNNENLLIERLHKKYDGTIWNVKYRHIYEYDSNNNRTLYIYQYWDTWRHVAPVLT